MMAAGARLGPDEIVAAIGAGSMGEVHQARETIVRVRGLLAMVLGRSA
jgi:hypothetical protein